MSQLSDYDFLDPDLQKCPYHFNQQLRSEAPVYLEPKTGYYLVSTYELIKEIKRLVILIKRNPRFRKKWQSLLQFLSLLW